MPLRTTLAAGDLHQVTYKVPYIPTFYCTTDTVRYYVSYLLSSYPRCHILTHTHHLSQLLIGKSAHCHADLRSVWCSSLKKTEKTLLLYTLPPQTLLTSPLLIMLCLETKSRQSARMCVTVLVNDGSSRGTCGAIQRHDSCSCCRKHVVVGNYGLLMMRC